MTPHMLAALLCLATALACGRGGESAPAGPAAAAPPTEVKDPTMDKHDRTAPDALVAGPTLEPSHALLAWLDREARPDARPRRRLRLPVVVRLADSGLAVGEAFVGVSAASPGADPIALRLDDTGMGVPLLTVLRDRCPDPGAACAMWLEGYWGALVEMPALTPAESASDSQPRTFAVLKVLERLDETPSTSEVRVLIQPTSNPHRERGGDGR